MTTVGVDTSTVTWAAYEVINGIGMGGALQLPYTALQAVLKYIYAPYFVDSFGDMLTHRSEDDLPIGNG